MSELKNNKGFFSTILDVVGDVASKVTSPIVEIYDKVKEAHKEEKEFEIKIQAELPNDIDRLYKKIIDEDYFGKFKHPEVQKLAKMEATREAEILLIQKRYEYRYPEHDDFTKEYTDRKHAEEEWYENWVIESIGVYDPVNSADSQEKKKEIVAAVNKMYIDKRVLIAKLSKEVKDTRYAQQQQKLNEKTENILKDIKDRDMANVADLTINLDNKNRNERRYNKNKRRR